MRFLLSDGNATYSDGVFTFALDRRLRNATRARVRKVSYVCDTGLSVVPNIVYLRSRAFHSIAAIKHSVILTASQHENSVDVLAALEEEHATGRFRLMEAPRSIPLSYTPAASRFLFHGSRRDQPLFCRNVGDRRRDCGPLRSVSLLELHGLQQGDSRERAPHIH